MFNYNSFNLTEPKRIYLSRPNRNKIGQLNGINSAKLYVYLQDIWKIDFEVDKYIKTVAPTSVVDALNLIDLCAEYNVDLRLALVQGHLESHFATKGTAARTYSIFNVGAFDGHSAEKQKKNGYGYKHPDYSVEPYLKLLTTDYLVDGKTELDLLNKFVNKNGKRYASSTTYESMLKDRWDKIDEIANITQTYETYKMYKLMLGR